MKTNFKILTVILCITLIFTAFPSVALANDEEIDNEVYGGLPSSNEYISSLEPFDFVSYDENGNPVAGNTGNLPSSVDLSTSPYFPAIGNQGTVPSCTSFAAAYYQFTYEANKKDGVATTPENTYCPNFPYTMSFEFENNGNSSFQNNYNVLTDLGCLRYSDYNASDIDTDEEFKYFWSNNTSAKIEALKKRAEIYIVYVDCNERANGVNYEASQTVTFNSGSYRDTALHEVKLALSMGKVLTTEIRARGIIIPNDDGQFVLTQANSTDLHSVAIVGYDDSFEVDADNDGVISDWEKGAFKVADSKGANAACHNNGYFWILYDAINYRSACPDSSYNIQSRRSVLYSEIKEAGYFYKFYCIDIVNKEPSLIGKISLQTNNKFNLKFGFKNAAAGTVPDTNNLQKYPGGTNINLINTATYAYTGDIVFDFSSIAEPFESYRSGYSWYFAAKTGNPPGSNTINGYCVIDDIGETIVSFDTNNMTLSTAYSMVGVSINLQLGDLDYDGVLTSDDVTLLRQIINTSTNVSNVKKHLADFNSDGAINSRDTLLLSLQIEE